MITKYNLYKDIISESLLSEKRISEFFDFYNKRNSWNKEKAKKYFKHSYLPKVFVEIFNILFYLYDNFIFDYINHNKLLSTNEKTSRYKSIKKYVKKYAVEEIINQIILNDNLIDELNDNILIKRLNKNYYQEREYKYIAFVFKAALKNIPDRITQRRNFNI